MATRASSGRISICSRPPTGPGRRPVLGAERELPKCGSGSAHAGACVRCPRAQERSQGSHEFFSFCGSVVVPSSDNTSGLPGPFKLQFCVHTSLCTGRELPPCSGNLPVFVGRELAPKKPASSIFWPQGRMMKLKPSTHFTRNVSGVRLPGEFLTRVYGPVSSAAAPRGFV